MVELESTSYTLRYHSYNHMLIRHISVYLFTATIILYWQNIENQYVGQNLLRDLSLLTFDFYSHFPLTNGRGYLLSILGQMLPIGAPP